MSQRIIGNALALFRRQAVMRPKRGVDLKPPAELVRLFQGFQPPYQYNNGVSKAYYTKMVLWTQPGQWCGNWIGRYQTEMVGGGEYWTERYFWGFRNGEFREIKQHGVRGPRKRLLRG